MGTKRVWTVGGMDGDILSECIKRVGKICEGMWPCGIAASCEMLHERQYKTHLRLKYVSIVPVTYPGDSKHYS
jgi:hypothetical protein